MFDHNKDIETRDIMIYGDYSPEYYKFGGIRYYKSLSGKTLRQLVDNKFADEDECQNSSPSIGEFLEFLEAHPDYTAHGYTISDTRNDYRVSIEGIEKDDIEQDRDTLAEFVSLNRFADTLDISKDYFYIEQPCFKCVDIVDIIFEMKNEEKNFRNYTPDETTGL